MGVVIYTGIRPEELVDPKRPTPPGNGPFMISGYTRYGSSLLSSLLRVEICRQIHRSGFHNNPDLFRSFLCSIYCFPDPNEAAQVWFQTILILIRQL